MRLDILCGEGSPIGTTWNDIYGESKDGRIGLGGAENSLHTMCELWAKAGHRVRLYNNPRFGDDDSPGYEQLGHNWYSPADDRDVLIIFRSPVRDKMLEGALGQKLWWSTDQQTVGNFRDWATKVDKIVCISPFHQRYFNHYYGLGDTYQVDLPVRVDDYDLSVKKVPNKLIFCSVPDRGLEILREVWSQIVIRIPDVHLVITSDYKLWTGYLANNEQHRLSWMHSPNVEFLGALPRREMIRHQLEAEVLSYPCTYDELFCISVAECLYAGATPVTSTKGALETTNKVGGIPGNPFDARWKIRFADAVVNLLRNRELIKEKQQQGQEAAKQAFHPDIILKQWDKIFND